MIRTPTFTGLHLVLATVLSISAAPSGAEARYGHVPVARTFGVPVGFPSGHGYYDAQDFGVNNHLGEDWNGVGGGATDLGDPVAAMADGLVTFAEDLGYGWGNVVRVVHHTRLQGRSVFVESVYAHLDRIDVEVGVFVASGQPIGTIGDAHGAYVPHLHFEVRRRPDLPLGPGYSAENSMFLDPSAYIAEMQ